MTDRVHQLLLEILLIRARYSPQEIERLARMVTDNAFGEEALRLMEVLDRVGTPGRRPKKSAAKEVDPQEAKEQFLKSLRVPRSSTEGRRLKAIAKRLGLEGGHGHATQLIERVRTELDRMGDRELRSFLKPYRLEKPADEGYVGLANYLMHNT